jgi:hypothetical protein
VTARSKKKPAKPIIKAKPEAFIGHESMTMLGTESWQDFEKRIKAQEAEQGLTAPVPAHVPEPVDDESNAAVEEEEPKGGLDEDSLPEEYEG